MLPYEEVTAEFVDGQEPLYISGFGIPYQTVKV